MITFVYAQDCQGGIGYDNAMPWYLPHDLQFFKATTMGHTLLMGRKTFESMNQRLLPGRKTVVMSRDASYGAEIDGLDVITTKAEALALADQADLMIIGGTEIFNLFWDEVDQIIRTFIDETYTCDTFMPPIDTRQFQLVKTLPGEVDEENPVNYRYEYWQRK